MVCQLFQEIFLELKQQIKVIPLKNFLLVEFSFSWWHINCCKNDQPSTGIRKKLNMDEPEVK